MADEYGPTTSIDRHTIPIDAQMPLLEPSSNLEDTNNDNNNNNILIPITINKNKPDSSLTVEKSPINYNQSSDQHIIRSPSTENKTIKTSDKLFLPSQLKSISFYQALFSEFIGTMILTLICTSTGLPITSKPVPDLHGSLASGFIVATIVVGFGHVSGAHINPAVTVSFLTTLEIDIIRGVCYIGVQLIGAISASSLLKSLTPSHAQGNLGMTMVTEGISVSQAIIVEVIITFILCFTVQAISDKKRDDIGGSKALAVGLAVIVGCLFGGPYTGGSMNPARSFGPAAVMNSWKNHWVYWIGPLIGGITAALIYKLILKKPKQIIIRSGTHSHSNTDKSNHI